MTDTATLHRVFARFQQSAAIAAMQLTDPTLAEDGSVRVVMPFNPAQERFPESNQFHGGPLAALIDTVGDLAVGVMVGGGVPTINLRIDYLRPAFAPHLVATARVRRLGKTIAVADIDIHDANDTLVAIGRGTYSTRVG